MVVKYINQALAILGAVFIVVMMLSTVADVSARYLFNSPILGTLELNRTLLVFAAFFPLGYTQFMKRHIRADLVLSHLAPRPRVLLEGVWLLLALIIAGFISYGCLGTAYKAMLISERDTGIVAFPLWPGRFALAIGYLGLVIEYVVQIIKTFRSSYKPKG